MFWNHVVCALNFASIPKVLGYPGKKQSSRLLGIQKTSLKILKTSDKPFAYSGQDNSVGLAKELNSNWLVFFFRYYLCDSAITSIWRVLIILFSLKFHSIAHHCKLFHKALEFRNLRKNRFCYKIFAGLSIVLPMNTLMILTWHMLSWEVSEVLLVHP